jgi:hypothetical protein
MSYFDIAGLNFKSGGSPMLAPALPAEPVGLKRGIEGEHEFLLSGMEPPLNGASF